MKQGELLAITEGVAEFVRDHVGSAMGWTARRLKELEDRIAQIPGGKDGRDGKDGCDGYNGKDGQPGRDGANGRDGADGKDGAPGRDAPPVDYEKIVAEVLARIPVPKDGKDGPQGPSGKDGRDGIDGKDGAPGINGKDGSPGRDGRDGIAGVNGEKGADGANGRDGKDGVDGKNGADGLNGKDGANGVNGKDGVDGLGIEDFDVEYDGERTFTLKWANGERSVTKTFKVPVTIYREIYNPKTLYEKGDSTTYGGALWIATRDAPGTPGTPNSGWRLAVKNKAEK